MSQLIKICNKYRNVTKNEMKNINLKIYTKNDFLNHNKYLGHALHECCTNNNILILKYFIKRFSLTKDEIMIPDVSGTNCLHNARINSRLSLIKYLINTYNLTKNDFMKIGRANNNCLHYLFSYKCAA